MNSKFFVPYETAKKLEAKGYPYELVCHSLTEPWQHEKITYHEAVDWLESKGIRVFAHYYLDNGKWVYVIEDFKRLQDNAGFFPSREETLNAAILKALELI